MRKFIWSCKHLSRTALGIALIVGTLPIAQAVNVQLEIENLSAPDGVFLTPTWVGLHDGSFDLYNRDEAASEALERIAEDGNSDPLSQAFAATSGGIDSTVAGPGGPIGPGEIARSVFIDLDPSANRYFSYAAMIIPSNDAFIANGDPMAFSLFDDVGNFLPLEFIVLGAQVLDAGTEVNTEIDAAFLNQMMADAGDPENGVVTLHPGFNGSQGNPGGTPLILGGINALGGNIDEIAADFTRDGFQVARFSISQVAEVPEPTTLALMGLALFGLTFTRRTAVFRSI